ncbi:hypothetical protein IFM89_001812 [Coptis chinensis]|uniref:Uncharacterized protein n=1 Tax=Coptis chinensis TaxID=261450 RepID=A0A835HHN6_9MAGN|nr:hypothetical protein IFM89_001812 [Coptis chinensis]
MKQGNKSNKFSSMVDVKNKAVRDGKNTKSERPTNNKNGVIITFYVESAPPRRQCKKFSSGQEITRKQCFYNNNNVMGSPSSSRYGYDRKAQLLAYARKLRSIHGSQKTDVPRRNFGSSPKLLCCEMITNQWRWRPLREKWFSWPIFSSPRRKGWKYEHIATLDTKQRKNLNYYFRRLRFILKEVSSCHWDWSCSKG